MTRCDLTAPDATCPRCGFVSKVRGAIRQCRRPPPQTCGPGCHLKRSLEWFGIRDDGKCGCGEHAAQMDTLGPDWCEENIDTVVGWLREAAAVRLPLVPFVESVARQAVRSAIAAARREVAAQKPK